MAYASSVWLGSVAALCPSQDSAGDGTTTATDFTGVGNGTLTNMDAATDWVTDEGKRCLDLDGVNDYVITACTPIGGAKCLGISVHYRRTATSGNGLFCGVSNALNSSTGRIAIYHFGGDGNLYVQFDGSNYARVAMSLTDLNWHSLIVHYNGAEATNSDRVRLWIDGAEQSLSFVGTIPTQITTVTAGRMTLGAIANPTTLYGASRIDDVRCNLRLFSDSERSEIDASRGGTYTAASGGASQLINGGLVRGQVL